MSENIFRLFARYIAEELPKFMPRPEPVEQAYDIKTVDLQKARDKDRVPWGGDYILVAEIDGELDIRLNDNSSDPIELDKVPRITSPFYQAYLTNTAQSGKTALLYIGKKASFQANLLERYHVESNVLRGEDNTEVSRVDGGYLLKKTVTIYHSTSKNPFQNTFVSYKTTIKGNLKATLQSDAYAEETYEEILEFENTEYEYKELADVPNKFEVADWLKLRIYLYAYSAGTTYNDICKVFGNTKSEVSYVL